MSNEESFEILSKEGNNAVIYIPRYCDKYLVPDAIEQFLGEQEEEIEKLKKENKKLRDCVDFYANAFNWVDVVDGNFVSYEAIKEYDAGLKARQVLKEIENNEQQRTI